MKTLWPGIAIIALAIMPAFGKFDLTKPIIGQLQRMEGTVLTLAVGDSKREILIPTEVETQFFVDDKKTTMKDLHAGQRVQVTFKDGVCAKVEAWNRR